MCVRWVEKGHHFNSRSRSVIVSDAGENSDRSFHVIALGECFGHPPSIVSNAIKIGRVCGADQPEPHAGTAEVRERSAIS